MVEHRQVGARHDTRVRRVTRTAEQLRRVLEVNLAAGDIGEEEKARFLARIAAAQCPDRAPGQRHTAPAAA